MALIKRYVAPETAGAHIRRVPASIMQTPTQLITRRAMNDFAATPTVPESAHGTPPERQIPLPLTPPATDEWHSTSVPQSPVSAALNLIRQRQCHESTGQSRQLKLKPLEYRNLLTRLEEHPKLKGFVNDKLRYATLWIAS